MLKQTQLLAGLALSLALLMGCAAIPEDGGFSAVTEALDGRVIQDVVWRRGGPEDAAVDARIQSLLDSPLTMVAAVQVGLLKNPGLQAHYEELGVAQADLVQAGLLSNPVLEMSFRPLIGEDGRPILELGLAQNFANLLFLPMRQRIAEAEWQVARHKTAAEILAFTADVREAYVHAQGAAHRLAVLDEVNEAAQVSADTARAFHDAGNITELELNHELAAAFEMAVEFGEAEAEASMARDKLALILGLADHQGAWGIAERLPELPDRPDPPESLTAALISHPALDAAKAEVEAAAAENGIAVREWLFEDVGFAVSAEREGQGEWVVGPEIEFPLPLFDQGRAAEAAAAAEWRAALREVEAVHGELLTDAHMAATDMRASAEAVATYRDEIIPLKQRAVRLTLAEYNYMLVGVFDVLEAKNEELEAALHYLELLERYWQARSDLEAALGQPLPGGGS